MKESTERLYEQFYSDNKIERLKEWYESENMAELAFDLFYEEVLEPTKTPVNSFWDLDDDRMNEFLLFALANEDYGFMKWVDGEFEKYLDRLQDGEE